MSNIKKKKGDSWKVLASGKATGIAVVNPKLLLPEEEVVSVDTVLERQNEDISLLKRNVAWLAKHGGGGSGPGGGGGGSITEATCDITVNGVASGGQVMVDNNGLVIALNNISAQTPRMWNIVVRVGVTQIAQGSASFTSPVMTIPLDKISKYLINHAGNLYIGASYEDDTNGIYGSASWNGSVVENIVNIATTNASFNYEGLSTAQLVYQYSVGIVGAYTMTLNVTKNGNLVATKEYPVNINSTAIQTKAISVEDLLGLNGSQSEVVGVYTVDALLSYNTDPKVQGSHRSTITIVSDSILVSTTTMSPYEDKPVEVSLSASLRVVYTAYLQGAEMFRYKYYIGNTLVKDETIGYFGQEIVDTIPVSGREWAVEGEVVPLHIDIMSGDKSTRATFYVKFVAASSTFLEMEPTAKAYMVSEFLSRNYDNGTNLFNLSHEGYENGGGTYTISSKLQVHNENNLSTITVLSSGQPYLRLSNGAYAKLDGWRFGNRDYTLPNLLTTKAFTISLCFKADYHPDDYRTILYCGAVDINTGEMLSGVSIDAHDVYINNESRVKLTDNTVNMVDITCLQTTTKDTTSSGEVVEKVSYIVKIYLDGVLTAVNQESEFPKIGDAIYFGSRVYNAVDGKEKADYLCDCNIYNFQLFDHALSDFDVMVNYINNKVSTNYSNGNPNFSIINDELKTNFCERDSDGGVVSYMFNKNTKQYSIDFLLDGAGKLSEDALNNYARVLGIPIMLIDVSTDEAWTFNNFVTQQTAGNVSLPATSGKTIQYWDPTYNDFSVKTLNDVAIELQGTSTLADAVKNLNISVPTDTVFIPKDTWFPEQTYTLKADVVDSSHSNNASIGSFINEVLGYQEADSSSYCPFDQTAIDNVYKSDYKKNQQTTATLKHTVEGFPVLLIMKFNTSTTSTVSVTPLGIYSFNLGRDAYRNLGFRKLNSIKDSVGETPVITTFPYVLENATFNETDSDANWIEIKDTTSLADLENFTDALPEGFDSSKGDFWQNDDNILNTRYEVRFPAGKQVSEYRNFKTFVGNIMQLPIEGTYDTSSVGTLTVPQVSDSYDLYTVDKNNNYSKTGYKQAIVTDANTLPQDLGFNPESTYKYLVVGLMFGLIDNFGKNSTYRSWNNGQYYIDFYDLDCGLGGGNQGQLDISPDVWIKFLANKIAEGKKYGYVGETFNKAKAHSGTVVSANHSKLWMSLDTAFYRAYSGNTTVNSAYTQYWYSLRAKLQNVIAASGYTDFADFFIDNYYIKQTKNCGPLLFNYDYKLKYLLQFADDSYGNTKDLTKLHGRKIAYARDWLKKHIQFMDSLFYWRDSSQTMTFANDHSSRGSNTVYNTPDAFPMKSNAPIVMYHSVGNTTQTFYFMQSNKETFVNAGSNSSNSALNWNFTNSPNIIQLGNDEYPLSMMNINILAATENEAALNITGYPSITDLNLANNNIFGSGFNLAAFERGNISELRKLNFHATSGASFRLSLNNTTAAGQVYTKYQKLTEIDISESTCVSGLDIPSIPLTDLKVYRSAITSLNLDGQKYLGNVDLTGCNKLQNVLIKECDAYTEFNITGLANLTEVVILNCPNLKTVNISNCPNLVKVDIEGCNGLTDIAINGCPSITGNGANNYITISECGSLVNVDLSNNTALETFRITKSNQSKIAKLHLTNTLVSKVSGDNADSNLLDLSLFTSLKDFSAQGNSAVKQIQFANVKDKYIILDKTFQGCANLERIYGNIKLTNSSYSGTYGAFRGCSKFSIHGNATTWNNKAAYTNGVPKTPWEICSGVADNRGNAYDSVTANQVWVAGNKVTNLWFSDSSNQLNETFRGTAVTQFDVYYVFFMLVMSGVTKSQGCSYTFRELTSPALFNWSQGKQPDRYMFYKCSMVTSFSNTFSSTTTFLYSPEDGKDNGLFSPLTGLSSIGSMFGGSVIFSKKLFHRTSGNYSSLSSFTYESVACICDTDEGFSEYSNYSNAAWLASNAKSTGNFDGFFKNAPRLSSFVSAFSGIYTINFSTLVFPTSITTIRGAFNPTYGTGEIDLEKMFQAGSTSCNEITNSFVVSGSLDLYGEKASMPIRSTSFSNINNVQYIGYRSVNAGGSVTATSFRGAGLRKYIADDTFPESIVSRCTSLVNFAGFFREVENKAFSTVPLIPGNMFLNNRNLQDVSALMYNADFAFKLSGEGFKNCPSLQRVSYFCYHDLSTSNRSKLTGEIPYRLFYHGHTTSSKVVKGTNQTAEPDESFDLSTLQSTTVTYNSYNKGIVAMDRAFYGCIGLDAYTNAEGKSFIENNADYTPYKWIYNETSKTWSEGKDSYVQDGSWGYTGQPSTKASGVKYLEEDVSLVTANTLKTETLNFMCAPDLLRYCANSGSLGVTGLFENCGFNYSTSYSGGTMSTDESYYSAGIQGRIPSYLLQPVSEVANISRMFRNCRRISSYSTGTAIYQIPEKFFSYAPKVSSLVQTFSGLSFIHSTSLNIFGALTNALDIRCIFAIAIYGDAASGGTWTFSGVFMNNTLSRISGAFSCNNMSINDGAELGVTYAEHSTIGLSSNVRTSNNFPASKIPAQANIGYTYYGWGSKATDAAISSTNNNYS